MALGPAKVRAGAGWLGAGRGLLSSEGREEGLWGAARAHLRSGVAASGPRCVDGFGDGRWARKWPRQGGQLGPAGGWGGAAGPTGDTCVPCPSLWKLASSLTAECVWNQTSFTRLREKRGPGKVRRGWGPPGGCRQQHRTPPAPALRGTAALS